MLAAHIRVMGGDAAVAEIHRVDRALEQVGKNATGAGAGAGISAGMKAATQEAGKLQHAVGQVGDAAIRMATYMGLQTVVEGFSAAVGGVLDFDQAMTESLAIQQGVTGRMRGEMEDLAKSIAVDLGMAPKQAAEGFYFLASAGLNVEQQMAALPQVAAFAKAGMMELEQATEMAYDVLSALGLKVQDPVKQLENLALVTDVMTQAAIDSQGTVEQFAEALSNRAGGSIKAFGLDLEESVGLLEVFADQGIKGKVAGERFSMLIRDMALKSLKNADAWKELGISVYDAGGNMNGILPIMTQIDKALLPMTDVQRTEALKAMGFTLRDVQTILSVLGKSDDMARFTKQLDEAGGAAQRVAENQMESLRSKIDQVKSFTIVMAIEGWEKLQEAGNWLATTFAPAIDAVWEALANLRSGEWRVLEALGSVALGGAALGLQGMAKAIEGLFSVLANNKGLAEGLGYALAGIGGALVIPKLAGLVAYLGGPFVGALMGGARAVGQFAYSFLSIQQSSGTISAIGASMSTLGAALSRLVVPAGIAAGIFAVTEAFQAFKEGERNAREFRAEVEAKYDMNSAAGISAAISDVGARYRELKQEAADVSFGDKIGATSGLIEMFDIHIRGRKEMAETKEIAGELEQAWVDNAVGLGILGQAYGDTRISVADLNKALEGSGTELDTAKVGQVAAQLETMGIKAGLAKIPTQELNGILTQLAQQAGIKMDGPWDEWVPQLAELYTKFTDVRAITQDLGGLAEGTGGKMSSFEEALATIRSEASNAEEQLKSLKTILDTLATDQGVFGADIAFQQSLVDLQKTIAETGPNFDILTEGGRRLGASLIGAADDARNLALAIAADQGVDAGVAHLQGYADTVAGIMRGAGATEEQVRVMLGTLNLTPEEIKTIMSMVKVGEDPADTKKKVEDLDGTKANVEVGLIGGEEVNQQLLQTAQARYARFVALAEDTGKTGAELDTVAEKRDAIYLGIAQADKAEGSLNYVSRNRDAIMDALANPGTAEGDLNFTARLRDALMEAKTRGVAEAEWILNDLARRRDAEIVVSYTMANAPMAGGVIDQWGANALAEGGLLEFYGRGGLRERHVAQIAPAGSWRIWGEPETGGEAYIPLAQAKRQRSMAIYEEVGRRFGVSHQPGGQVITLAPNISVQIDGAGHLNPESLGAVVRDQAEVAVQRVMTRALVELRAQR